MAHVAEMTRERGLNVSPSCIWRWVQGYGPELDKRCRNHLKPTNKSWRVDETYIKVNGEERFLYRAEDSTGQMNRGRCHRCFMVSMKLMSF